MTNIFRGAADLSGFSQTDQDLPTDQDFKPIGSSTVRNPVEKAIHRLHRSRSSSSDSSESSSRPYMEVKHDQPSINPSVPT